MSEEQIIMNQKEFARVTKLNLLRDMLEESKICFSNKSSQEFFEITNFIESYFHEL